MMRFPRHVFFLIAALSAGALMTASPGCGRGGDAATETKPIPVFNPDPNNPNSDISLENESENMDRLKGKKRRASEY